MRFLLDQGLPRGAAVLLSEAGCPTRHLADLGMSNALDPDILGMASAAGEVVVTLDSDFHAHLAATNASGPSVIRLREQGLRREAVLWLVLAAVQAAGSLLETGGVASVTSRSVRSRSLPLRPDSTF